MGEPRSSIHSLTGPALPAGDLRAGGGVGAGFRVVRCVARLAARLVARCVGPFFAAVFLRVFVGMSSWFVIPSERSAPLRMTNLADQKSNRMPAVRPKLFAVLPVMPRPVASLKLNLPM